MTWLFVLLACSDPDTAAADTAEDECPGPTLEEFASVYSETYCTWVMDCPDPPEGLDWSECVHFSTLSLLGFSENYYPCRAQECLDHLDEALEACESEGEEWGEIEVCRTGYFSPPTSEGS